MTVRSWAAGVTWTMEIPENEAHQGRGMYAHGLGTTAKGQGSGHLCDCCVFTLDKQEFLIYRHFERQVIQQRSSSLARASNRARAASISAFTCLIWARISSRFSSLAASNSCVNASMRC